MKLSPIKTNLYAFVLIALFLFLTACAPPAQNFKRTGSPVDFNDGKHSSQLSTGCPGITVSIAAVGKNPFLQNDGSLMGAIVSGAVKKSDRNRNEEYLRLLQNADIQQYSRETSVKFINDVISDSKILNIDNKCEISCAEKTAKINENDIENWKKCPKADENLFSMGSRLLYHETNQGDVMEILISLEYRDSTTPRKVIFSDIYASIEMTDMFDHVETINESARKLVDSAFDRLKPWIRTDLVNRDNWFLVYPLIDIEFKNGFKNKGYKLDETDSYITIRNIDGKTEVIPKKFIENFKISSPAKG